ncbi:DUF721 domain-containing protein [Candidatus Parcubacteria bacterium]|nr:DUF721 domain-containing protein [Candidatus Parcubacteria bacterium]
MALEAITSVLVERVSSLSPNQRDSFHTITREVRLRLRGLVASEQISEAALYRGTLTIRCRSAATAAALYFRREVIKQNLSVALGVSINYLRLRT